MIVIDASAAAPFVLPDEAGDQLAEVRDSLIKGSAIAPTLLAYELANIIWKTRRSGRMTETEFDIAATNARALTIGFDGDSPAAAMAETLTLAARHDLTAYDASYLELALRRRCTLATFDRALRAAALEEGVKVLPRS